MSERYPNEVLCLRGALGHDYEAQPIARRSSSWGVRIEDRCVRCVSHRIRIIDSLGRISARWYEHSDAYADALALGLTTEEARLGMVQVLRRQRGGRS